MPSSLSCMLLSPSLIPCLTTSLSWVHNAFYLSTHLNPVRGFPCLCLASQGLTIHASPKTPLPRASLCPLALWLSYPVLCCISLDLIMCRPLCLSWSLENPGRHAPLSGSFLFLETVATVPPWTGSATAAVCGIFSEPF